MILCDRSILRLEQPLEVLIADPDKCDPIENFKTDPVGGQLARWAEILQTGLLFTRGFHYIRYRIKDEPVLALDGKLRVPGQKNRKFNDYGLRH
jgi:hypothetical protein